MFRGIENCNLELGVYLEFGAWNLGFSKLCNHFEHNILPKRLKRSLAPGMGSENPHGPEQEKRMHGNLI
ncbi:MAG: hypothetical protein GY849_00460 [Deltaproteobacteria bacterium]|nr:hypothetical protein [Deltaproteobacteria bacterium]